MADTTARPEDVDIGQLGSMFGVQTRNEPDYLEYDIRGRGYMERLFFNCGASYLGFMLGGGVYGTVQGLRLAPANAPLRVRTNALMNGFGKHGATAGNAAGAVALMFTSFESLAESVELDKICGDQAWVRLQCLFYQCVACDDERRRIQLLLLVRRPIQIELFKSDALLLFVCDERVLCLHHVVRTGEPRRRRRADGRPLQGRRGRAGRRARVRDRRRARCRVPLPAGAALRVVVR
jgi:hypothetical protein